MGLDRIIRRCLEKTRSKRFQNAEELHAALESLAGERGGLAGMRGGWIGVSALGAAALIAGLYWQSGRKPAPAATPAPAIAQIPQAPAPAPPAAAETVPPQPPKSPAAPPKKSEPVAADVATPPHAAKGAAPDAADDAAFQHSYEQGMLLLADRKWASRTRRRT